MKFAAGFIGCVIMLLVVYIWPQDDTNVNATAERYPFKTWYVSDMAEAMRVHSHMLTRPVYKSYIIEYIQNVDLTCNGESYHLEFPQVYRSWEGQNIKCTYDHTEGVWQGVYDTTIINYRDRL